MAANIRSGIVALAAWPACFFAVIYGWQGIDAMIAKRQAASFIADHRDLVARQLADDKVHSLSLMHDPRKMGRLLIQVDVEDKATFDRIESELDESWSMRFPPRWEIVVRS
jgi:hypothetical protein